METGSSTNFDRRPMSPLQFTTWRLVVLLRGRGILPLTPISLPLLVDPAPSPNKLQITSAGTSQIQVWTGTPQQTGCLKIPI